MDTTATQDGLIRSHMQVDRAYKGVSSARVTIVQFGDCSGPILRVGDQYLMYAHRQENGDVISYGCSSRRIDDATEDLKYLEGVSQMPPTAAVSGKVRRTNGTVGTGAAPGAVVAINGPHGSSETTTDSAGHYSFAGLAPATYSVTVKQTGFRMLSLDSGGIPAKVAARGCAVVDVTLRKDWPGIIAGRLIRSDDSPAPGGIPVSLKPVNPAGEDDYSSDIQQARRLPAPCRRPGRRLRLCPPARRRRPGWVPGNGCSGSSRRPGIGLRSRGAWRRRSRGRSR